jgi:anti-anti-sigma regulatory factor
MSQIIQLETRLTHDAAVRLWDILKDSAGEDIELDASEVRHLGATALQVLLVANNRDGAPPKITSPSEAFREKLALLGAENLISGDIA